MSSPARALITGASGGIGLELARLFAADGQDLVLVARSEAKLDALAEELEREHGIQAAVVAEDLADHEGPARVQAATEAGGLEVHTLVNNAGFGSHGKFWELDRARELAMIDLNIRALADLTHRYLPAMIERGAGRILNIGSTAGFQPGPNMATYYATKVFVLHFTEALAHELRGSGVTATVHCPGPTATGFAETAGSADTKMFNSGVADGASVARDAYAAMKAGEVVKIHGLFNRVMAFSVRLGPRALVRTISGRISSRD